MKQRGRKSAAAKAVAASADVPLQAGRPAPPAGMPASMVPHWIAVVNRMPVGWFGAETFGMLAQYCGHVAAGEKLAQLLEKERNAERFSLDQYERLLRLQKSESNSMQLLATKLRISPSAFDKSRPAKRGAGAAPGAAPKPWED